MHKIITLVLIVSLGSLNIGAKNIFEYARDNAKSYDQRKEQELLQQELQLRYLQENEQNIYNDMVEKAMREREDNNNARGLGAIQRNAEAARLNSIQSVLPSQTQANIASNQAVTAQQKLNLARTESAIRFLHEEELIRQNEMNAKVKKSESENTAADI
jgi:hypothetical protein